jgi:hypothetical protein
MIIILWAVKSERKRGAINIFGEMSGGESKEGSHE